MPMYRTKKISIHELCPSVQLLIFKKQIPLFCIKQGRHWFNMEIGFLLTALIKDPFEQLRMEFAKCFAITGEEGRYNVNLLGTFYFPKKKLSLIYKHLILSKKFYNYTAVCSIICIGNDHNTKIRGKKKQNSN